MAKKINVPCTGEAVKLQEDRNLFARMMVICKRQPEIDIKEAVGTYKFRVVLRSMFAADGTLLHWPAKSALIHILERLPSRKPSVELLARSKPIFHALGPLKTAALPSFLALTGADNTGSFAKKGKPTCWSVFNEAHNDVIKGLSQLGTHLAQANSQAMRPSGSGRKACLSARHISAHEQIH